MSTTKFKKGQSGNPNGRPKGKKGKLSNEKLAEELSKGDVTALNTVLELMQDDKQNGATRLRSATAWIGFSLEMRKRIQDEIKREQRDREEGAKDFDDEDDYTPVISMRAIDGGKK